VKIAVISDTHDHKTNILRAVNVINERKVDVLIHCGDYVSPFVTKWFDKLHDSIKKNFYGVFGNNDGEHVGLKVNLKGVCDIIGMEMNTEIFGKKIFTAHMPSLKTVEALAKSGEYDIILFGHTHNIFKKKYENEVLALNPGEVCGYLTNKSTFAIIDTERMEAEIIEL